MACKSCKTNPVINLPSSNIKLCKSCFSKYFERKAFRTIGKYKLIGKKEKVAVAVSGGKDSFAALYILNKLAEKKKELDVIAIGVDEGIKGYRNLKPVINYCKKNRIKIKTFSFKKEFGFTLDQILKKVNIKPCTVCGALRRVLLNSGARKIKATKLATGHNLDDEAQTILMNMFKNNMAVSARLGPLTGVIRDRRFIPRIKPLYFLTEKEVMTFAKLKKFPINFRKACPYKMESYRNEVGRMLNKFEKKHAQTKQSIVNSFLEVLPLLKKRYEKEMIKSCKLCNEPCSRDICKSCEIIKKLKD